MRTYPKDREAVLKAAEYSKLIRSMAEKMCVADVYDELIRQYPQFEYWSGSHNHLLHHYGRGGLVRHTWEIIDMGIQIIPTLNLCDKLSPIPFFLAALFHDTGKMFDYELIEDDKGTYGDPLPEYWKPTEHRRLIHHLPRSALIFHDVIKKFPELEAIYHDDVLHAILAHHGRRDDGSPVAPKTRLAWLVHLCDSISARMDDAERIDVVKKPAINV